jgi:PIN domain nuclease of toxin-antitoxin system
LGGAALILLDTHIWVWWVQADPRLTDRQRKLIQENEPSGLGVSVISVWEVAQLVHLGQHILPKVIDEWVIDALNYPGMRLIELSREIAIDTTRLPDPFHRDPADRIIVTSARNLGLSLLTADGKILAYLHVACLQ